MTSLRPITSILLLASAVCHAAEYECVGTPHFCSSLSSAGPCASVDGCDWLAWTKKCVGDMSVAPCSKMSDEASCLDQGCRWEVPEEMMCSGTRVCFEMINDEASCRNEDGCSWWGPACAGSASRCSSTSCDRGCSWVLASLHEDDTNEADVEEEPSNASADNDAGAPPSSDPSDEDSKEANKPSSSELDRICEAEFSRRGGERQMTIKERLEPAHECTCGGPMRLSNGDGDDANEVYTIDCNLISGCEICSFGRCLSESKFTRTFEVARENADGTFDTNRIQESHCFTFTAPGAATSTTSCTYTGKNRVALTLNGKECDTYTKDEPCDEGSQYDGRSRPTFDCTSLGDQVYDSCYDKGDGLVPDPEGSAFFFLHEDFGGSRCTTANGVAGRKGCLAALAAMIVVVSSFAVIFL